MVSYIINGTGYQMVSYIINGTGYAKSFHSNLYVARRFTESPEPPFSSSPSASLCQRGSQSPSKRKSAKKPEVSSAKTHGDHLCVSKGCVTSWIFLDI